MVKRRPFLWKKQLFVSLLVAGLLISPAVLAQHVQEADQVNGTTTGNIYSFYEVLVTEIVTSTQGDTKEKPYILKKVEEVSETNGPTTSPTAPTATPTTELHEEPASIQR